MAWCQMQMLQVELDRPSQQDVVIWKYWLQHCASSQLHVFVDFLVQNMIYIDAKKCLRQ